MLSKAKTVMEHVFGTLDWLGMDLDHTLVRYKLEELLPHIYNCLGASLLKRQSSGVALLPRDALEKQPFDLTFCSRGLVFDTRTGDLLRLSAEGGKGSICAARHGYAGQLLSSEEILMKYGDKGWRHHALLRETGKAPDALVCSTFVDSPAIQLLALMVDFYDKMSPGDLTAAKPQKGTKESDGKNRSETGAKYAPLLPPLFEAFGENFNPESFASGTGEYFRAIRAQPGRFVIPRPELRAALDRLRSSCGTRIAIVTNSDWDYANLLLESAFGLDWRRSFDLCVYRANKKRGFFTSDNAFEPFSLADTKNDLGGRDAGRVQEFCGGNATELQKRLLSIEGLGESATMVYCGDDLWGDAEIVRRFTNWHTVGIVEELQAGLLENGCYENWSRTTALSCQDESGMTLLGELASRCEFCCADLVDLLVPASVAVSLPVPMVGPMLKENAVKMSIDSIFKNSKRDSKESKSEVKPAEGSALSSDTGKGNVIVNVASRAGQSLLSFHAAEGSLRVRSEFCRAALDWPAVKEGPTVSAKGKKIKIFVDPPYLANFVQTALSIDPEMDSAVRRPFSISSEHVTNTTSVDAVVLKVLCEQLGLNVLEAKVDAFLEKDLVPHTAMEYLIRASQLQPYGELTQACVALAAKTAANGGESSDLFLSSINRHDGENSTMPSAVFVDLLHSMRDWYGTHERVRSEYALAYIRSACRDWATGNVALEDGGLDLEQIKAIVSASGAVGTIRFDPDKHPVFQAARKWCHLRYVHGAVGSNPCPGQARHLDNWLRCNCAYSRFHANDKPDSGIVSSLSSTPSTQSTSEKSDMEADVPALALENSVSISVKGYEGLDAPTALIYNSYANIFNHVAVRKGWRVLPFRLADIAPILVRAARHVSSIRAQLDAEAAVRGTKGFTMRKIGGCSWDYLFSLRARDLASHVRDHVVCALVKATLKDGSGFVEGLTSARVESLMRTHE